MSINESDKPTVTSMPEGNAERQLENLPQTSQSTITTGAPDSVAPAVVLADIKPGHEIGAGATASDYAEAMASSNNEQTQPEGTAAAHKTNYNIQPSPQTSNADTASSDSNVLISSYINNAVNDAQRQRIIHIVENWVNNGNCDKAKLQDALQAETVKDSMHLLEIAVEIMSRLYKNNVLGAVFERRPGIIGIRSGASSGNMQQSIRLMGMENGSVRLSYLKIDGSTPAQKAEDVFPDTPDTDAEVVVKAAMDWLSVRPF